MIERLKRGGAGRAISGAAAQLAAIFNGILDTSFLSLSLSAWIGFLSDGDREEEGEGEGEGEELMGNVRDEGRNFIVED